jgi:hypothetical protein
MGLQCDGLSTGAGAMAGALRQQEQRQEDHGDHRKKEVHINNKDLNQRQWTSMNGNLAPQSNNKQRQW